MTLEQLLNCARPLYLETDIDGVDYGQIAKKQDALKRTRYGGRNIECTPAVYNNWFVRCRTARSAARIVKRNAGSVYRSSYIHGHAAFINNVSPRIESDHGATAVNGKSVAALRAL